MTPPPPFTLSPAERAQPVWRRLVEYMEQRLQVMREQNDFPADPDATATLRGRIAFAKEIIGLGKDPPFAG